jgi:hypothetical protein
MSLDLVPLPNSTFSTYEDLFSQLQEHTKAHGYAVAVGKNKREWGGIIYTRYIQCVKSGKPRDRVINCKKPLISQKTKYPFRRRVHRIDGIDQNGEEEVQWELTANYPVTNDYKTVARLERSD